MLEINYEKGMDFSNFMYKIVLCDKAILKFNDFEQADLYKEFRNFGQGDFLCAFYKRYKGGENKIISFPPRVKIVVASSDLEF
ncbi:hypothetical protein V8J88_05530 [Massilia sp. W12]|uniref:hypothetical protein n=1 Tax=Massilia sp. W12 TaxID=3126507 RepID=UPI0030D0DE2A